MMMATDGDHRGVLKGVVDSLFLPISFTSSTFRSNPLRGSTFVSVPSPFLVNSSGDMQFFILVAILALLAGQGGKELFRKEGGDL